MKRKLVNIGEGRIVDMEEVAARKAAAVPPPKRDRTKKTDRKCRKARSPKYKKKNPGVSHPKTPGTTVKKALIPGFSEWLALRMTQINQFKNKLGFSPSNSGGIPHGCRKAHAKTKLREARKRALIHMENMDKSGLLPDDEIVRKAVQATLEVMEGSTGDVKLRAGRQLLEFFKAKPVIKTETTVNAAESWLASLADAGSV